MSALALALASAVDLVAAVALGHPADIARAFDIVNVLASSDGESGTAWLLLSGPAAGGGLYWALFRYYRNTDKSHQFERETRIESQPVTGTDAKVDEVRGTKRRAIQGDNVSRHRERVQRVR